VALTGIVMGLRKPWVNATGWARVGVRVGNFEPLKNHTPSDGSGIVLL